MLSVVKTIASLSSASKAPTDIRLLNKSESVVVGMGNGSENTLECLLSLLSIDPVGRQSIGRYLLDIVEILKDMEDELLATRKVAVLIIMTCCESTDGGIVEVLKLLVGFSIKIVIRICTEGIQIAEHWQSISAQLDLDISIMSHVKTEAMAVSENNNWLTYAEPLHCLREFGIALPAIDNLGMQQLSPHELWTLARIL